MTSMAGHCLDFHIFEKTPNGNNMDESDYGNYQAVIISIIYPFIVLSTWARQVPSSSIPMEIPRP